MADRDTIKAHVDVRDVAAGLAPYNSDEQALFFNTFALELKRTCETEQGFLMQTMHICDSLDKDGQKFAEALAYQLQTTTKL